MTCNNVRKEMYISEYPVIANQKLLDAKTHIKTCNDCRKFLDGEKAFSSLLRQTIKKDQIPEKLKVSLLTLSEKSKAKFKSRTLLGISYQKLIAGLAVLILVIGGYFILNKDSFNLITHVIDDHIQLTHFSYMQINTSNPAEISKWLKKKVNFPVNIPNIPAKLKGGKICYFNKKRHILIIYEHNNTLISLTISDTLKLQKLPSKVEMISKNKKVYLLEKSGYLLALWQDKELNYILVSELNIEEIKKFI